MKHFLFYEKQTIKQFWKNALFIEKIFLIVDIIFALFFLCIFSICILNATNKLQAGALFGICWVFLFPGIPFLSYIVEKSYWVLFEDNYVLRHGNNKKYSKIEKIFYEDVKYIITGNVGPYIVPYKSSSEWYHKKMGNYINILSSEKNVLFTVRYSEEMLNFLQEKCKNAQIMKE